MLISQFAPSLLNIKGPGWDQNSSTQNLILNTEAEKSYKFCKNRIKKLDQMTIKTISFLFFWFMFITAASKNIKLTVN